MIIKDVDLNLEDTVTCGQCFRWTKEFDNSFTIILKDRVINIKQDKFDLIVNSNVLDNLEETVIAYFDLDNDYEKINQRIVKNDSSFIKYINISKGLKMLNQDPFETIISYIISQNNHVRNIMRSIELLSNDLGEEITFNNKKYYLFPKLEAFLNLSIADYRKYGVGFRDKYIYNAIQMINNKNLDIDFIRSLESDEAIKYLCLNNGIGPKVASCILLFSYKRYDVFPIDTWVKKYFLDKYPDIKNNEKAISKWAKDKYGEYCGLAIQYLFHYKRNKNSI